MHDDPSITTTSAAELGGDMEGEHELPRLILVFEGRTPLSPAVRLMLSGIETVHIGRGARSWTRSGRVLELRISDSEISRQHVRLQRSSDDWELIDLGSKNGTLINGVQATRAVLVDGDLIEVGSAMLAYRDGGGGHLDATDLDVASTATMIPDALRTVSLEVEQRVAALIKIAPSMVSVMIRGETGTGKELTAKAIHELSGRRGAFIPVNCGAVPRTLIESELFGSKRGAFSGARDDRVGLVQRADRGTLFLDEIAELPAESQVALLRVLQEGEVRPVGSADTTRIDVRVVAATHQDLEVRIADGRFRQDLYARLAGYIVSLPPLRARREDIGTLIGSILGRIAADPAGVTVQRPAARALLTYPYPLNIRELEQALRAAVALTDGREIRLEHLPEAIRTYRPDTHNLRPEDQALRDRLAELLHEHRGNVTAVGRALGKAPIQIRRWCRRYEIEIASFRDKKRD